MPANIFDQEPLEDENLDDPSLQGEDLGSNPEELDEEDDNRSLGQGDDSDEDESTGEESAAASEDEDDAEQRRQENRNRRAERKHRARMREEEHRRTILNQNVVISELTKRLNAMERRNTGVDLAQVEGEMANLQNAYTTAQNRLKQATEDQDGNLVVQATEHLFQIRQRYSELEGIRKAITQQTVQPPPLDQRVANHARQWMADHRWYRANGQDPDSRRVRRIDQELAEEGLVPSSPIYWSELTKRVKKELPHRYKPGYNDDTAGNGSEERVRRQPVGSSGDRKSKGGNGKVVKTLSPDRVNALKQAGLWNNPTERARAIKSYEEFDLQQQSSTNSR